MIGIISDVHGNFSALQAVIQEIDGEGCDQIISLGDVCGYYCEINECIELLRERGVINIVGNHDHYMLTGDNCPRSRSVNELLLYQRNVILPENIEWLSLSLHRHETEDASYVHGGWADILDEYVVNPKEEYFSRMPFSYYFSGHTHIQILRQFGERFYCNPGSVGQPRDRDPRAAFALFDGTTISLRRVSYDVDATAAAMKKCGFDSYYYVGLYTGDRIGFRRG